MTYPDMVLEFQSHVGAPAPTWPQLSDGEKECAREQGKQLMQASAIFKNLFMLTRSNAFQRIELMLEELGEALQGIAENNRAKTLDGLADAAYVVIGTAVSFDLPFNEAFEAVHNSNMTKSSRAAAHTGDKGKGFGFRPPDIAGILARHDGSL